MTKRNRKKRGAAIEKQRDAGAELTIGLRELVLLLIAIVLVVMVGGWWLGSAIAPGARTGSPVAPDDGATVADSAVASAPAVEAAPAHTPAAATVAPDPGTWLTTDGDPGIGSPSAPVTVVEFSDYQCSNCRQFATEVLPRLKETWIRRGFVRLMLRDFAVFGENSIRAAEAAHCAGEQGRYWTYHDRLFEAQASTRSSDYSDDALIGLTDGLGLNGAAFAICLGAGRYRDKVAASTQYAFDQGFEGTPTFQVNGRPVVGNIPVEEWDKLFLAFEQDLARATGQAP